MLLKSQQIWLTAQHMRRVYCWGNLYKPTCIPVLTGMHTHFLTWHEESLLLQRSLYQPLPRHELTKNNSQVIAGGPEAKALMRYHLQLAPSRYVLVLPTANLPLVLPVLHMCAHTHPLVLFALPRLLLLILKPITFPLQIVLSKFSTLLVPKWLRQCSWNLGKQDSKSTLLSLKNASAWKAAVPCHHWERI